MAELTMEMDLQGGEVPPGRAGTRRANMRSSRWSGSFPRELMGAAGCWELQAGIWSLRCEPRHGSSEELRVRPPHLWVS